MSKWGLVLPVTSSVTQRLFVKITWNPVREGPEKHKSLLPSSFSARIWPKLGARAALPRECVRLRRNSPWDPSQHCLLHLHPHPPLRFPASQSWGSGPWPYRDIHMTHRGQDTFSVTAFPSCFPPSGVWGFSMKPK